MPDSISSLGISVKNFILLVADLLTGEAPPGLVVLALAASALILGWMSWNMFRLRIRAVRRLRRRLEEMDGKSFVRGREGVFH